MKKSFFGFTAKVAMAVLAVCSFVLTSCYEKPAPTPVEEPVYYVVGTVYDATTSVAIADAKVTVNGSAVTVSNGSFTSKLSGPGAVAVAAEAEGYVAVSRTVQVVAVGNNQTSVTTADLAMVPVVVEVPVPETGLLEGTLTLEDLIADFGFPENTEIEEDGTIMVCEDFQIETHLGHDAHIAEHWTKPYLAKWDVYSGYITNFKNDDAVVVNVIDIASNQYMQTAKAGKDFADFIVDVKEEELNPNGSKCLMGYHVCHMFEQHLLSYIYDGVHYEANLVKAVKTVMTEEWDVVDSHDTHDSHDSHDAHNSHNSHNTHGSSNAGGGEGIAE